MVGPRAPAAAVSSDRLVRDLALAIAAAECAGGARWCLETATAYAKDRRQFGRPIGQFQAIKHRLADMLVSVEQVTALAWDAARAADAGDADQAGLSAVLAGALALDAYVECAKGCVQVLGGMGFTWEHDAHLHLRRALSLRQLLGRLARCGSRPRAAALAGSRRRLTHRAPRRRRARPGARSGPWWPRWPPPPTPGQQRRLIVENGPAHPPLARPLGAGRRPRRAAGHRRGVGRRRGAPAVHRRGGLGAAHHHRPRHRRAAGALRRPHPGGEIGWCQLFSEPGAGSDLAALSTRATRDRGRLGAQRPEGVDVDGPAGRLGHLPGPHRPRGRQARGHHLLPRRHAHRRASRSARCARSPAAAMFNEVFFTDVFVPDDCVVGPVNGGWRLARTTLANERVSMSSGATFGLRDRGHPGALDDRTLAEDAVVLDEIGGLLAEAQSMALLGARTTLRSVSGVEPGPEASVRKLLGAEHEQRVQELGLVLLGAEGASTEGDAARGARGSCPPAA